MNYNISLYVLYFFNELMKASPPQATGENHTVTCALKNEGCDQAIKRACMLVLLKKYNTYKLIL